MERWMRPCRATRAGTQAPPLPISIIFFHTIPYKQNNHFHTIHPNDINHSRAIHPNEINRLRTIRPNEMRRGGAYVPARTSAYRRFHAKITYHVWGLNDGCAPVGRHGRAHRHRPYPSPSYFSTQSHTNKITICTQSTQRKPTVHVQSAPTHLHQITRCAPTPSPPNHAVCHYPIGVVLSIAQGRQVQRSLPWVTMQARRLPHWGLYFFSSHIITTRDE